MDSPPFTPYRSRRFTFLGTRAFDGYRLKVYTLSHDDDPPRIEPFEAGLCLALDDLPRPAVAEGRLGVGFVILHRGRTADYVVLGWWDRENELPIRVFLSEAGGPWRPARGGESVCVWDLEVIWFERRAYVDTILSGHPPAVESYLSTTPVERSYGSILDGMPQSRWERAPRRMDGVVETHPTGDRRPAD